VSGAIDTERTHGDPSQSFAAVIAALSSHAPVHPATGSNAVSIVPGAVRSEHAEL
jgi:hypothetical protein